MSEARKLRRQAKRQHRRAIKAEVPGAHLVEWDDLRREVPAVYLQMRNFLMAQELPLEAAQAYEIGGRYHLSLFAF